MGHNQISNKLAPISRNLSNQKSFQSSTQMLLKGGKEPADWRGTKRLSELHSANQGNLLAEEEGSGADYDELRNRFNNSVLV